MKKRSNAPIFWLLFGGGGVLSALTGVALVLMTGVLVAGFLLFRALAWMAIPQLKSASR